MKKFTLLLILFMQPLCARVINEKHLKGLIASPNAIEPVVLTLQKTGSHLLVKCVELITGKVGLSGTEFHNDSNTFYWTHSNHTREFTHPKFRVVSIIRDPRDQIISFFFMYYTMQPGVFNDINADIAAYLDEKLPNYSVGLHERFKPVQLRPHVTDGDTLLINAQWGSYMRNMFKDPKVYITRFEKLVGPLGGGTKEDQIQEILNIAHHLETPISVERAHEIGDKLFGNTFTFVSGQIGKWKRYFTEYQKELLKKTDVGELLILLGYEKDYNW